MIDPDKVEKVLRDCLYKEDELLNEEPTKENMPAGTVLVEGCVNTYALNPERLKLHEQDILGWLTQLPHGFRKSGGGGWSLLNGCMQEDGVQWTGLQMRADQLFCLGMGLGLVKSLMPREMMHALPGGLPYYVIEAL